jgi:hypothetical protein
MYVGGRDEGMDARLLGFTQGFGGTQDICFRRPAKGCDCCLAASGGNRADSREISFGGDGKARFDNINAERFKLARQPNLLCQVH